jgi:hypothetical protein
VTFNGMLDIFLSFGLLCLGASYAFKKWRIDIGLEYLTTISVSETPGIIQINPPSTGTTWEFQWPGKFGRSALTPSLSFSYEF